jgi:hypothetical protein
VSDLRETHLIWKICKEVLTRNDSIEVNDFDQFWSPVIRLSSRITSSQQLNRKDTSSSDFRRVYVHFMCLTGTAKDNYSFRISNVMGFCWRWWFSSGNLPLWLRQKAAVRRRLVTTRLHGTPPRKIAIFVIVAVRAWKLSEFCRSSVWPLDHRI